jgi:hypothetical protein
VKVSEFDLRQGDRRVIFQQENRQPDKVAQEESQFKQKLAGEVNQSRVILTNQPLAHKNPLSFRLSRS